MKVMGNLFRRPSSFAIAQDRLRLCGHGFHEVKEQARGPSGEILAGDFDSVSEKYGLRLFGKMIHIKKKEKLGILIGCLTLVISIFFYFYPSTELSGKGFLSVRTHPWTYISIHNKKFESPLYKLELPQGNHEILLSNPEKGIQQKIHVEIQKGQNIYNCPSCYRILIIPLKD